MGRPPPLSAQRAAGLLTEACGAVGLDPAGARLLRLGENALFHLPAPAAVVRIARTVDYWSDVINEVAPPSRPF